MCTLRGFWVLDKHGDVLFSRRYPTVEKRVASQDDPYVKIPADKILAKLFCEKISNPHQNENVYWILALENTKLWPVVYLKKDAVFLIAIPSLEGIVRDPITENTPPQQLPLINMPFLTATTVLLEELYPLVKCFSPAYDTKKLRQLQSPLSRIMPFGRPIDTNIRNIVEFLKVPFPVNDETINVKKTSWKPTLYKGKQLLEFKITETINAIQYDKPYAKDTCQIQGVIDCKALIEGTTEVTAGMTPVDIPGKITQISTHMCVQRSDNNNNVEITKKFVFSPPRGEFVLCRYDVSNVDKLPIRGFYQMKEISPTEVKVLLQLKLQEYVRNDFAYCRVILPFFHRGKIAQVVPGNTAGEVRVSKDRKSIEWDLGTKFTAKNLEVAFPASVFFGKKKDIKKTNTNTKPTNTNKKEGVGKEEPEEEQEEEEEEEEGDKEVIGDPLEKDKEEPFCFGTNSYVKLEFQIQQFGHLEILGKNVSLHPKGSTANFLSERTFQAGEYLIWNSWGDVHYAYQHTNEQ